MHGKLVQEAKKKTARSFGGKGRRLEGGGKEDWEHSEWEVFGVFCFVLVATWRVVNFFPLRQCLAELLCNVLMQSLWRVMLRNDENLKGSEP